MRRDAARESNDDRVRVRHMVEAASQGLSFLPGRSRADLDTDHMFRRALKDCIQEIGEAAYYISEETRARAPQLPWAKIVGMRHILVHAYFSIDNDAIWKVASQHLQELLEGLVALLASWES